MKIRAASLVNRFYVSDGWTKEAVAELLSIPDIRYVEARYEEEKNKGGEISEPLYANSPVLYYAVYDTFLPNEVYFIKEKVDKHLYQSWQNVIYFKDVNRISERKHAR